jgi:RecA-family ATPase
LLVKELRFPQGAMREDCVDPISDTVREADARFDRRVGLIIIDTISKGVAACGGDEDRARDTNIMLANLRRVEERTGVRIACVGHTGKDETRGHRGSSAHLGDVDLMVQIASGVGEDRHRDQSQRSGGRLAHHL